MSRLLRGAELRPSSGAQTEAPAWWLARPALVVAAFWVRPCTCTPTVTTKTGHRFTCPCHRRFGNTLVLAREYGFEAIDPAEALDAAERLSYSQFLHGKESGLNLEFEPWSSSKGGFDLVGGAP